MSAKYKINTILIAVCALLIQTSFGYGVNMCRTWKEDEIVQDFSPEKFYGNWFPKWTSKNSPTVIGQCPIFNFAKWFNKRPKTGTKRMRRITKNAEKFILKTSYLGLAGLVDNERKYRGLFNQGSSQGSMWVGVTQNPMKKFLNNFVVLSTDYENYAIAYKCTFKTVMYNKDMITILLRDPSFSKLQSNTMDTIKSEFERLFGEKVEEEDEEEEEEDDADKDPEGVFKEDEKKEAADKEKKADKPDEDKSEQPEPKIETTETNTEEKEISVEPIKEDEKEETAEQDPPEEEVPAGKGKGNDLGRKTSDRLSIRPNLPLDFDTHLREHDHEDCLKEDYPDLSLSREQRLALSYEKRRQQRQQEQP